MASSSDWWYRDGFTIPVGTRVFRRGNPNEIGTVTNGVNHVSIVKWHGGKEEAVINTELELLPDIVAPTPQEPSKDINDYF